MTTRAVPFGKYFLLERINMGGMAEIYRAKMVGVEGFQKLLAIKRILPAIAADKDFISMFIDEAKISVQLNHANIAQTFELGRIGDTYFIALEYVPGRDLRAVAERLRRRSEPVPPEFACYVVSRVAEGLDYAHRKRDVGGRELGIVHRDISPQNVLVSWEGEVKLIDFGIAKAANKILKTQAGILKGKFGYMSPEQVRGLPLDRRSDIFAAGIVLYELLSGERLFTGESDYSVLEKVRHAQVPPLSQRRRGLAPALERIVSKALAREPEERYQWASELVADLQRYLLSRERLWTREDTAAWMKGAFPDEFEREKRALAADVQEDLTPTPAESASRPLFESGARLRPVDPNLRRSATPPRLRLADAARAASTDKVATPKAPARIAPPLPEDDETTRPSDDDPVAGAQAAADDATPTDSGPDMLVRALANMETRVAEPPPVADDEPTGPPGGNGSASSLVGRRGPAERPDVAEDDDDEPTQLRGPSDADEPFAPSSPARPALPLPLPPDDEDESTMVSAPGAVYRPKRRRAVASILAAALALMATGVLAWVLLSVRGRLTGQEDGESGAAPRAASKLATLVVKTEPEDSELWVDGKLVKPGGMRAYSTDRLEPGVEHVIVARKDGFREASERVSVPRGESRELNLRLQSSNPLLVVRTIPAGATVYVDHREVGRAPESVPVAAGSHQVRVELRCYDAVERQVLVGGNDETVEITLRAQPGACAQVRPAAAEDNGFLRLSSRPPARVFIDGEDTGRRTPVINLGLAPGRHVVRLDAEGGLSEEFPIEIKPGKNTVVIKNLR